MNDVLRLQTVEATCAEIVKRQGVMASLGRISFGALVFLVLSNLYGYYYRAHVTTPLIRTAAAQKCPVLPVVKGPAIVVK